jgi:chromosome segregation ATPase
MPAREVVVVESEAQQRAAAKVRKLEGEIAQLRVELDANRSRADAADVSAREVQEAVLAVQTELAEIRASADAASTQSQEAVLAVQAELAEARASADAASTQSQKAVLAVQAELAEARASAEAVSTQSQEEIVALQAELAEARESADAASTQSQKALEIASEVLSNLIAARESQRGIVERNLETFGAMDQRLESIERLVGETRRQRESDVAAALVRSAETDMKLQRADRDLARIREQLAELNQQNEQLRSAYDSAPMMSMLRDLEATRRETSMLRGAMEEVQREQEAGRKRLQNYYIDLDARIQALQEEDRAARSAASVEEVGALPESAPIGAGQADSVILDGSGPIGNGNVLEPAIENEPLQPLEIEAFDTAPENAENDGTTLVVPLPLEASPQRDSLLQEQTNVIKPVRDGGQPDAADATSEQPVGQGFEESAGPSGAAQPAADIEDAVGKVLQAPQRQPVTAHGVITTDWEAGEQPPISNLPVE